MGDVGETFQAYNESKRDHRNKVEPGRIGHALQKLVGLQDRGLITKVSGSHDQIVVLLGDKRIDFWPYTGWFCGRKPIGNIKGRGIANLIKEINKCVTK